MARIFVVVLIGITLVSSLEGCGVPVHYEVSLPAAIPSGFSGSISSDILTLDMTGLAVLVQVQNHIFAHQVQPPERLVIFVEFRPEHQAEPVSFEPTNAMVASDHGEQMRPVTFVGPDRPWVNPRGAGRACGSIRGGRTQSTMKFPAGPVTFTGRKCFILWFDTSPSPDREFLFVLGGIRKAQEVLPAIPITYKKGSLQKWHPVP